MLKKLQNLLFEDEDYEEDEEEEFEPEEVTPAPAKPVKTQAAQTARTKPAAQPAAPVQAAPEFPAFEEEEEEIPAAPKKTMQRIDVTQPLPVVENTYAARPQQQKTYSSESVFAEQPVRTAKPAAQPAAPAKTAQMGIKADSAPAAKTAKPAAQPARKAETAAAPKAAKPARPAYNFQPVISPIFGVNEKDMNAVKTTTSRINAKEQASRIDGNISPIISPMYGSNTEESIIAPKAVKKPAAAPAEEEDDLEDVMSDFSIDDILAASDEKFAEEKKIAEETLPLFPDLEFDDDTVSNVKGK